MIFIMTMAFVNLVFIASIFDGLLVAIDDQVKTNYVSHIVIEPQKEPKIKSYIKNAREIQRQVETIDGVIATAIHYRLSGTISFDKEKRGDCIYQSTSVVSIDPEKERNISGIAGTIVDGRYLSKPGRNDIILGADLAGGYKPVDDPNSLGGAKVGDKIRVVFGNGVDRTFRIRGIFKTNFAPIDAMSFITNDEAESILAVSNSASQILVKVDGLYSEDDYIQQIKSIAPNLEVRKWTEYIGVVGDLSTSFNMISAVVSIIGLIVAAITIFMLIFINVRQKRRQVGILKAIGIPHDIVIYSYLLQTVFYWFCGIIIGLALIFFLIAPYFTANPLETPIGLTGLNIDSSEIMLTIVSLLAATLVGGLIPAWRGARENILKAIWGN
jgi:putative ABC transport system permease protein